MPFIECQLYLKTLSYAYSKNFKRVVHLGDLGVDGKIVSIFQGWNDGPPLFE
jgi:hypothetical protein